MTLDRLKATLEYYRKHEAELRKRVDGLARKMGVDPEKDILMIPLKWCKEHGWNPAEFPEWVKATLFLDEQAYIVKGVRNRLSKPKGE